MQLTTKLNSLQHTLPDGMPIDAAWFEAHGYSRSLRAKYVQNGWLDQLAWGVYRRAAPTLFAPDQREKVRWQQVVVSLQTLLDCPVAVGGRTALELLGLAHYLAPAGPKEIHLYGASASPKWIFRLKLQDRFLFHNAKRLFTEEFMPNMLAANRGDFADSRNGLTTQPWGAWDWPLVLSTPERAILELMDEIPGRETFHQADVLMDGLRNLSPRRMQGLLSGCRSVKVKRLFLWFAERHKHAWLKQLDLDAIDLGHGKRMLVRGGKLDSRFNITVPADLDAVR